MGTKTRSRVEAVFANALHSEGITVEFLVDEGWRGKRRENGNNRTVGWRPIVPAIETSSGVADVGPVQETDYRVLQSLFSWAEFLTEASVEPKSRNGKPKPSSQSHFVWVLGEETSTARKTWSGRVADRQIARGDTTVATVSPFVDQYVRRFLIPKTLDHHLRTRWSCPVVEVSVHA